MNRTLQYISQLLLAMAVLFNLAVGLGGMALIWFCVLCFVIYRCKTGRA